MSSTKTAIEWTDKTWNPTTGCDKVSPGCKYCYAKAVTERFPKNFPDGFKLTLHPERLDQPNHWRKPSRIFVNSMSDLFHEKVPISFLEEVFEVMRSTPQHIYQVLTKRPKRMLEVFELLGASNNVWAGVSVENQDYCSRIDYLRQINTPVRFLSCEPLLGPLQLDLTNIDWVIVGGESGAKHREIKQEWVEEILQQCQDKNVAFFFKQWGGRHSKAKGRSLNDQIWDEMPDAWLKHLNRWNAA
jgi:protein gp37